MEVPQLPWKEEENPVAVSDDVAIRVNLEDFRGFFCGICDENWLLYWVCCVFIVKGWFCGFGVNLRTFCLKKHQEPHILCGSENMVDFPPSRVPVCCIGSSSFNGTHFLLVEIYPCSLIGCGFY